MLLAKTEWSSRPVRPMQIGYTCSGAHTIRSGTCNDVWDHSVHCMIVAEYSCLQMCASWQHKKYVSKSMIRRQYWRRHTSYFHLLTEYCLPFQFCSNETVKNWICLSCVHETRQINILPWPWSTKKSISLTVSSISVWLDIKRQFAKNHIATIRSRL